MAKPARAPRPELARLRREAGLTQQQLASALGLKSARAIKAWENGDYAPSMHYALPLARLLGVPVQAVVEAVAGPDPWRVGAAPERSAAPSEPLARANAGSSARAPTDCSGRHTHEDLPAETLTALRFHLAELNRLVDQLQRAYSADPPNEVDPG
jgi:DNA-binding XRE family transcriptional regulator